MKIILQSKLSINHKWFHWKCNLKEFNLIFKQNNNRKWFALLYVILFFILEIMIVTNTTVSTVFDHSIQSIFSSMVSPFNTKIFHLVTFLGSPIMDVIYLLLIMFFLYKKGHKESSLWLGFVLVSGNIISFLVKLTVHRQRPLDKIIPASGYSFPSGHVFGSTLVILALIMFVLPYIKSVSTKNILTGLLIIWVIIVAMSRVYLRGHFPTDVIGSILLASTWWECSELLWIRYSDSVTNLLKVNTD